MPGVMSWKDMNWLFPDFEETGLIYHGTATFSLPSIFEEGLVAGKYADVTDRHRTIYEALVRHRPSHVPQWVDPRHCIFGYINRKSFPANHSSAVVGIRAVQSIAERAWFGLTIFSNWLYCPEEAGYFDTEERAQYYRQVMEPACAKAYWETALSFADNRRVRLDHLLPVQPCQELLLCLERIDPAYLSLQAIAVTGCEPLVRRAAPELFERLEIKLRCGQNAADELSTIEERCRTH